MRLVSSADRVAVIDLAVPRRTWLHVHDNKLVRAVSQALYSESPDIEEFLLPLDAGEVGRGAGFVGVGIGRQRDSDQRQREQSGASAGDRISISSDQFSHGDILLKFSGGGQRNVSPAKSL